MSMTGKKQAKPDHAGRSGLPTPHVSAKRTAAEPKGFGGLLYFKGGRIRTPKGLLESIYQKMVYKNQKLVNNHSDA
jgi:hypothetical protein